MTTIWSSTQAVSSTANADNSMLSQRFIATAGQTLFNITAFVYQPATGSLNVFLNGVHQVLTYDYTETSTTSITFTTALEAGDQVVINGFIGGENSISANQAAETAVAAAATAVAAKDVAVASAAAATAIIDTSATTNTIALGTKVFTVTAGKSFQANQYVMITPTAAPNEYMFGQVTSYVGTTLTVNVTLANGSASYSSWNVTLSGLRGAAGSTGITNIVRTAADYTLTGVATALEITPTAFGVTVTLPNASALTPADPLHTVINAGTYPVVVKDSTGVIKGFILPGTRSEIGLIAASAAGTWSITEDVAANVTASKTVSSISTITKVITIDADREFLLCGQYGVVYNNTTKTMGTPVLIRAAFSQGDCILSAANQVLVVSCSSTTGLEAVALTLSGTSITVNTAATATLSGNIAANGFSERGIQACNGSFIVVYRTTTPTNAVRAITVTGTTCAIGAASALAGTKANGMSQDKACFFYISGTTIVTISCTATTLTVQPYTVSGTTLTTGTAGTLAGRTAYQVNGLLALATGRYLVLGADTGAIGSLISISGTTATLSNVTGIFSGSHHSFAAVGANKAFVTAAGQTSTAILTDTSGTLSAGPLGTAQGTQEKILYVAGNNVVTYNGVTGTLGVQVYSASGVQSTILARRGVSGSTTLSLPVFSTVDNLGRPLVGEFYSSTNIRYISWSTTGDNLASSCLQVIGSDGMISDFGARTPDYTQPTVVARGANTTSAWKLATYTSTPTLIKVEMAP